MAPLIALVRMRRLLFGSLTAICAILLLTSCGGLNTPTGPSTTSVGGFGVIAGATTAMVDLAGCLAGSATSSCFSRGVRTLAVTGASASAPSAPGTLSTSSSGSSVTLTWSPPTSGDAVGAYIIEAGSAPGRADLANFNTGTTATALTVCMANSKIREHSLPLSRSC